MPIELLPPDLRDQVLNVAAHLQTPPEIPLAFGLGALSVGAAKRFVVHHEWTEPTTIWVCPVALPSERKTPAEREMLAPVREFELELREATAHERRSRENRRGVLAKRVGKLQDQAAKADDQTTRGEMLHMLDEAQRELDETPGGNPPRLMTDDCTPERLVGLMAENGGKIAIVSSEPDVFNHMAGKYRDVDQSSVYRLGWDGSSPITVDRQGREGHEVKDAALVVAVAAQPAAFETMRSKRELRGLGTLARFIYFMPRSFVGSRLTGDSIPPLDPDVAARYRAMLHRVMRVEGEHGLYLSPAARDVFNAWHAEMEPALGPSGELFDYGDWAGKLNGQTLRLAGLLHVAAYEQPEALAIDGATMECAVEIARAACSHVAAVFGLLERSGDDVAIAEYVLGRLDGDEVTVRELARRCQGKAALNGTDDVRAALELLERHGYVHVERHGGDGPGRPSEVIIPNPVLRNGMTKTTKPPFGGASGRSVNFVNGNAGPKNAEREGSPDA